MSMESPLKHGKKQQHVCVCVCVCVRVRVCACVTVALYLYLWKLSLFSWDWSSQSVHHLCPSAQAANPVDFTANL